MVVVAASDCGGGGDGHLCVIVLVVGVEFYLVCTWYQGKGFCADLHRVPMRK